MKNNRHTIIMIALVTLAYLFFTPTSVTGSYSETTHIIPIPVSVEHHDGFFIFRPSIRMIAEKEAEIEASKLIDILAPAMGYRLQCAALVQSNDQAIKLKLDKQLSQLGDEGYILDVCVGQILICARQLADLFYGIQQGFIDTL